MQDPSAVNYYVLNSSCSCTVPHVMEHSLFYFSVFYLTRYGTGFLLLLLLLLDSKHCMHRKILQSSL